MLRKVGYNFILKTPPLYLRFDKYDSEVFLRLFQDFFCLLPPMVLRTNTPQKTNFFAKRVSRLLIEDFENAPSRMTQLFYVKRPVK